MDSGSRIKYGTSFAGMTASRIVYFLGNNNNRGLLVESSKLVSFYRFINSITVALFNARVVANVRQSLLMIDISSQYISP